MTENEITPMSSQQLEEGGGENNQIVTARSEERRATLIKRFTRIGAVLASAAVAIYVLYYWRTGIWQVLLGGSGIALSLASLGLAHRSVNRGKSDIAGYWLLLAVIAVHGTSELAWTGLTPLNLIAGILLIFLVGSIALPRKWGAWLGAAGLHVALILLIGQVELLRYGTRLTEVFLFNLGSTVLFTLGLFWQIGRAFRFGTIRTRLLIAFVVTVVLVAVIIGAASVTVSLQSLQEQVFSQLESVVTLKEAEVNVWVRGFQTTLATALAGEDTIRNARLVLKESPTSVYYQVAYNSLEERFRRLLELTYFEELFLLDLQGQVLLSTESAQVSKSYSDELFFQQGLQRSYVQPPAYSPSLGRVVPAVIVQPVVDTRGEVWGVLAGRAKMSTLNEIMTERAGLGDTGETYLVGVDYALLTDARFITGEDIYIRTRGADAALNTQSSDSDLYENYQGERVLGVYRWLPELQVALLAEQGRSEALEAANTAIALDLGVALASTLLAMLAALIITRSIATPLAVLAETAAQIAEGNLELAAKVERTDEVGALAQAFNSMTAQLRDLIGSLERRVAERTQVLAHRSVQLETAAQIAEAVGTILELTELEQQVVELIRQQFDYYYVGLFLVDESGDSGGEPGRWAVLRTGTGEAGQAMLARGHKLEVGGVSMIGECVADGRAHIALDVGEEAVRFDNPVLPETRSEMALPLIARGQVIGALSVQSEREAAFSEEDVSILQTMATQVANAIQNARLFEQTQAALAEAEALYSASRRIASASSLQEIVSAVAEGAPVAVINRAVLWNIERDLMGEVEAITVVAGWHSGEGTPPLPVGTHFSAIEVPATRLVLTVEPIYFDDAQNDERLEPAGRALLQRQNIRGLAVLPLWVGTRQVAALLLESQEEHHFTEREIRPYRALAQQMAVAIENLRLLDETHYRATQLETAAQVSRAASSILDMDELLTTSVNLIRDRFDLYYVGLFLVDEAGEFAMLRAGTGEAGRQMLDREHKLVVGTESMIGWCVANAQARIALDVGEEAVRFDNPLLPETRSELALPLLSRGQVIGAMTIQSKEEAAFSEVDISVLQTMADQVANAITNARLLEAEQRRRQAAIALQEASVALTSVLDLEQVYQEALEQLMRVVPYDSATVFIYDETLRVARPVAARGVPAGVLEGMMHSSTFNRSVGTGSLLLEIIEKSRPIVLRDAQTDDRFLRVEGTEYIRGWMGVPMLVGDKAIGLLTLDSRRVGAFDEDVLLQAITFATQAGLAIENARLFQQTQTNLQEITRLHQRYLQERWEEFLTEEEARQRSGYLFDQKNVQPAGDLWRPEIEVAMARGQTLAMTAEDEKWRDGDGDARSSLVVPLRLRGQIIGALDFFEMERYRQWSEEDIALVEAVADQVALAVENARAYEEIQKTAVQLREVDELKSQFLANMSHELRTPLNSIIGFSRVLLKGIDGPLTELQRADLNSIHNNGQYLLGLINDILDLSRIEAGKMELVFEPADLSPIIDGVMTSVIGLVKDRPITLVKEVADDLPIVRADTTRIRQVILNLVSNAAKFTEEGTITLRAWADSEYITISITDTGIGIPEEFHERIFQEFRQVDGSATRRASGTGLGLPISRHFIELHGGRIWLESTVGVGSTFTFNIPIHGPGYVEDPELSVLKIDHDRPLVLILESDEKMVSFYRRYLERHGYQAIGLTDPGRLQLWVRELSPFAVLMDVILPETDGWLLLEKLKTSRETAHIPIVICSIVNEEARGLSMGAAAYLTKPVLEEDLLKAMDLAAKLQTV